MRIKNKFNYKEKKNDAPILVYTQEFRDHTGERHVWEWDKTKFKQGPLSVEIFDPRFINNDKLLKELEKLENKYIPKKGERKLRLTKIDKQRMEEIQKELDEIQYSFWPEDRPKQKGRKPKNK
jgi:hypothetical protein